MNKEEQKKKTKKENEKAKTVQKKNQAAMYGLTLKIAFVFVTHPKIESYV